MSRTAEVGWAEEEACHVVAEVEGDYGTRALGGRNWGDRTTWSKGSPIEENQRGRAIVVMMTMFLAVKSTA